MVVWLALAPERISKIARAAIDEARHNGGGLAICGITLLEIATANLNGRISLTMSLESFLKDIEKRFVVLPISARACARTLTFPADYPKDPADRDWGDGAGGRDGPGHGGPGDSAGESGEDDLVTMASSSNPY